MLFAVFGCFFVPNAEDTLLHHAKRLESLERVQGHSTIIKTQIRTPYHRNRVVGAYYDGKLAYIFVCRKRVLRTGGLFLLDRSPMDRNHAEPV